MGHGGRSLARGDGRDGPRVRRTATRTGVTAEASPLHARAPRGNGRTTPGARRALRRVHCGAALGILPPNVLLLLDATPLHRASLRSFTLLKAAMRRLFALGLLLALGIVPSGLHAQSVGTFSFLRLDAAPRSAALAGTLDAIPTDDPAVLFANPALLTGQSAGGLGFTYTNHLSDVKAGTVAYARSLFGIDAAVGLRYLSYGELTEADEAGQQTGTFGASSLALSVGASKAATERLRLGVSAGLVTSGIAEARATALAADVGAALLMPNGLTVSATVRNLGVTLSSLGATPDELPLDLRVGVSKKLAHLPLQVSVTGYDLQRPGEGPTGRTQAEQVLAHVAVGGELQFSPAFMVRAGFSPRRNQELRTKDRLDLAGLSLGAGIKVRGFTVDYAFASWSENGALHHLGLRTRLLMHAPVGSE